MELYFSGTNMFFLSQTTWFFLTFFRWYENKILDVYGYSDSLLLSYFSMKTFIRTVSATQYQWGVTMYVFMQQ